MPFINEILHCSSLSIIGMEKNTGKTECLNFIIKKLQDKQIPFAITSLGIDGETVDQVTFTHKPEIKLDRNAIFITSEKHYREKKLDAEILDVSQRRTSLGKLVTAKVVTPGKVILSGPPTTRWLKQILDTMPKYGVKFTLVEGALSRKTLASPSITDSVILTTGAALSPHIPELVRKTKFVYRLMQLDKFEHPVNKQLENIDTGLFAITADEKIIRLPVKSTLLLEQHKDELLRYGKILFISGIITDNILNTLRLQKEIKDITLVVKDFTKIFVSPEALNAFINSGGQIKLLQKNKLIAITVNPTSPTGYRIDSKKLIDALLQVVDVPVYDLMMNLDE